MFSDIYCSVFGLDPTLAGTASGITAAMHNGAKRGLFSNEAPMRTLDGLGTINSCAAAEGNRPSSRPATTCSRTLPGDVW